MKRFHTLFFLFCTVSAILSAQSSRLYDGTGGAGIRIAVLQPVSFSISEQEQWMLRLVQSTLTADLNKFTVMTVIDRQNLDRILGE